MHPHIPLGTMPTFKKPISVIYGDSDWTNIIDDGAADLLVKGRDCSKVLYVKGSAHNLHMDNPQEFCNVII